MAKQSGRSKKKAAKKEHPVANKPAPLGMTALTAFATGVGTEAAANMLHPAPSPTTVIVETQPKPETEWKKWNKGLDNAWSVPSGQESEENFLVTMTGEQGMKEEFFFKSAPRHLAVPTLAPADHPTNPSAPHIAVKTNAYGAPEDYVFLADKAHIIQYLEQKFGLRPDVKDVLEKVTEIKIAKAANPLTLR